MNKEFPGSAIDVASSLQHSIPCRKKRSKNFVLGSPYKKFNIMVDKKSKVFKKFEHKMNNIMEVELLQKSEMPVIQMIHVTSFSNISYCINCE